MKLRGKGVRESPIVRPANRFQMSGLWSATELRRVHRFMQPPAFRQACAGCRTGALRRGGRQWLCPQPRASLAGS
jgi:hypothetical protein